MNPNPTHAQTDNPRKGEKRPPSGQASRGQKTPNRQQPSTDKRRGGSEQDEKVRRSNQAGDQDVDDSGEDGQGPDGTR